MKLREILMGQLLTVGSNDLKGNTTYYLKLSYSTFYITATCPTNRSKRM